ncbi:MAG: hypothetical protein QOI86_5371 [Actinomycetota bacterium]|nr:hypothetical protein [Actinomycetota bacterium]
MARPLRRCVFPALVLVLLPALGFVAPERAGAVPDSTGVTTRVSVKSGGAQAAALGPAAAGQPAVSDNGAVVAFVSDATNLVPDDHNGVSDVFVTQGGTIKRVSVTSLGPNFAEADGPSSAPALSTDGRFVAFVSAADNLVPGDTNDALDVFVYDRQQSTVTRASVAGDGTQADGDSRSPSIDDTGAVVAFTSSATNLVPGDGNGKSDVYVRTLGSNPSTRLVSVATGGTAPGGDASDEPSLNGNGTQVAFSSDATDLVAGDTNGKSDVFWHEIPTNTTERVSLRNGSTTVQGNGDSFSPSLSGDGSLIAFASDAKNLSTTSDGNDATDVFLRDRTDRSTDLVSRCNSNEGDQQSFAPRITSDASAGNATAGITFESDAENLLSGCSSPNEPADDNHVTDVYFRPLRGAPVVNERVSRDLAGAQFTRPSLESAPSGDGRFVAFATGGTDAGGGSPASGADVFGRDRGASPVTRRLSAPADGTAVAPAVTEFPAISADGRTVAFVSAAPDLVTDDSNGMADVFVHDRATNQTARVSLGLSGAQPDGPSGTDSPPALSADGQIVAFASSAANLVTGDNNGAGDVFVYDRGRKETTRVSVGQGGIEATGGESYSPTVSADGRYVAFASDATNLVGAGDTNSATDVFLYDRQAKTTTRLSLGPGAAQGDGISYNPRISADGAVVAFTSAATNLVGGDTNAAENVFLRDVKADTTSRISTASGSGALAAPPSLSADGRFVAYANAAGTLVPGDTNGVTDVFVHDRKTGSTERVSAGSDGAEGNRASDAPSISGDGRFVAFSSDATNLVPGDTNRKTDVFVRDRRLGTTTRVSLGDIPFNWDETLGRNRPASALQADRPSTLPSISGNGRFVAFQSAAANLAEVSDSNSAPDIFVHDRTPAIGYRLVAADGGVFAYGRTPFFGSTGSIKLARPIVGMASAPTGQGYWLVASDGGVFAFGAAGFLGSTGAIKLARPIVGMAATPTGLGYWLVASDGGVFAFGDAAFLGSTGAIKLAQPIVGMAATPTGKGYWLVARDGGVFAFGDAAFAGSTGAIKLARPIVGLAASQSGQGYWLVAADGGIFAFGDAAFLGSTGALNLNRPIVGMAATPSGGGYWLVASDGGIFAFGDAPFVGSAGATKLSQPIVGMAGRV